MLHLTAESTGALVLSVLSHFAQLYFAVVGLTAVVGVSLVTSEMALHTFCLGIASYLDHGSYKVANMHLT